MPRARSLSIALMLESDGPGGAETVLIRLAEGLRERGHRPFLVGPADGCGWLGSRFAERGFPVEVFRLRRPVDVGCVRGLVETLRRRETDIVSSHEFTMAVYGAAAARWLGLPHIVTHHGGLYYRGRWRRRLSLRWACRKSYAVATVSRATARDFERSLRLQPGFVRVIYNGSDPVPGDGTRIRRELGVGDRELLILALGTLHAVKGHRVLLQALGSLRHFPTERVPWRLAIAGQDRGERAPLEALAREFGFADRVHLLGHRSDVGDLLAASDIFAMPSLAEGLPVALLEAMHAGKAIVASAVGGIPEAIRLGKEGLLVPPGSVPALAEALAYLLAAPEVRAELAAAAQARARAAFSLEAMASAYEELFLEAQANAGAAAQRRRGLNARRDDIEIRV